MFCPPSRWGGVLSPPRSSLLPPTPGCFPGFPRALLEPTDRTGEGAAGGVPGWGLGGEGSVPALGSGRMAPGEERD